MAEGRASDVFASPPKGTELQKINHFYDTVTECVNHLEQKMDESYSSCKKALADLREAIDSRRSLSIRGEINEKAYDVNVVSSSGQLRWAWYTDGSSGTISQGSAVRYGIGGFFGFNNPMNFGLAAPLATSSMFECEVLAIEKAFEAAEKYEKEQGGGLSRSITLYVDNMEAKIQVESALCEPLGSECLEALLVNNHRVWAMLHNIRQQVAKYDSVEIQWVRSHTGSKSAIARGNEEADRLAKVGLEEAFLLIEGL